MESLFLYWYVLMTLMINDKAKLIKQVKTDLNKFVENFRVS